MLQTSWICGLKHGFRFAVDLLRQSLSQVTPEAVVFDAWYMSKEILDFLSSRGLIWVSEAKSNRIIQMKDEWIQLKVFAGGLEKTAFKRIDKILGEKRYKWIHETRVLMKNVGMVKLVILRSRRNSKGFTFLVSNANDCSVFQVFAYYKKRWSIEVFHRDCKQHLGIGEYQARKLDAVVIHLHLVFLAYTLLKNAWCNPFLTKILCGIHAVGTACKTLKKWVLDQLIKGYKGQRTS